MSETYLGGVRLESEREARGRRRANFWRVCSFAAMSAILVLAINSAAVLPGGPVPDFGFIAALTLVGSATVLAGVYVLVRRVRDTTGAKAYFAFASVTALSVVWLGVFVLGKRALGGFDFGGITAPAGAFYGWGFFILNPLLLGLLPAFMLTGFFGGSKSQCYGAGILALILEISLLLIFSVEGAVCLAIALPIGLPFTIFGAWLGRLLSSGRRFANPRAFGSLAVFAPVFVGVSSHVPVPWTTHTVRTEQVIDAPPERIWSYLLRMPEIGPPKWWLFRAGVAYPVDVESEKAAIGARRTCRLSTGPMLETIDVLEPGRRLGFRVDSTPPTMRESNPFGSPHPPHLTTTFQCVHGEIDLEPLANGKTLIVGTSIYRQNLAPDFYWSRWCDMVVHEVHSRVFDEIERRLRSEPHQAYRKSFSVSGFPAPW